MADAPQDTSQEDANEPGQTSPATIDETVELIGLLDAGPAGFVRLFEDATRDGRYVDIDVEDIARLFPEEGADSAPAQTVIAVSGEAVILICAPVGAGTLEAEPGIELQSIASTAGIAKPNPPGRQDNPTTMWPRR